MKGKSNKRREWVADLGVGAAMFMVFTAFVLLAFPLRSTPPILVAVFVLLGLVAIVGSRLFVNRMRK